MPRKKTREEFIAEAKAVHGDKYDYSKVEYNGVAKKVIIVCNTCGGSFLKYPKDHIRKNSVCKVCRSMNLYGVAYNDIGEKANRKAYHKWISMVRRCYEPTHKYSPTYIGCTVCDEWLTFSKFAAWFDKHNVDGFDIDKDLIKKGNRVYCPEYCSFVPKEVNYLTLKSDKIRGDLPIGVTSTKHGHRFRVKLKTHGKRNEWHGFKTPTEAFLFYKEKKEAHIKVVANMYKDVIDPRVYDYLMKYEVDIND